ncbi:hypothetical protein PR001_g25884 [Phytophthora rubi]|uniref:Uncharacterized protein n=1 Tax=Phytophthora rubi TaxID=129364 RepID=A0A6A3I060_9STRA|nr:hypothetical protein PR002_g25819 [Phytophthora rubi]KAE8974809.1 hypothetical protein PR001_g25884 [Phytophthora rubi]
MMHARVFINTILTTWAQAVKDEDPPKKDLKLRFKKTLSCNGVNSGGGKADNVITLGKRLLFVIEAKKCNVTQVMRLNFTAVKCARLLNAKIDREEKIKVMVVEQCMDPADAQRNLPIE